MKEMNNCEECKRKIREEEQERKVISMLTAICVSVVTSMVIATLICSIAIK